MLLILFSLACTTPDPTIRSGKPGEPVTSGADDTAGGTTNSGTTDSSTTPDDSGGTDPDGPCPPEMALAGDTCVDRWEAALVDHDPYVVPEAGPTTIATAASGLMPQGYISGEVAEIACANAGKRLCTQDEWERACAGPTGTTWPYGNTYDPDACNDSRGSHPVIDYFGTSDGIWDSTHMNDPGINQQPDTVDPAGANPGCVSAEGHWDMHGNLHEWVLDPNGTFKGGFYADAEINGPGCTYTTTAHDPSYHDYSLGFRCCRDPR